MSTTLRSLWARSSRQAAGVISQELQSLLTILGLSLAFGAYFVLRYGGHWGEVDSVAFAGMIARLPEDGHIIYAGAYPHGYAYSVWAITLSYFTGLPVGELLRWYTPIIGNLFLGLFAFANFRRWLGSDRLGMMAASVLFLVPELVFTVSRGNHEKLTVTLTLLALLSLLRSFMEVQGRNWARFAAWLSVYYLLAFVLVSLNIFFGSSFIVVSTLAAILAWGLVRITPRRMKNFRNPIERLTLRVAASWLLVLLVMWYIYPLGGQNLSVLKTALAKLGVLALSLEPQSNPYTTGRTDWASVAAYRTISSFRWVLLVGSLISWLALIVPTFRNLDRSTLPKVFLLALYGAAGLQMALAIPVDLIGLEEGANLQVRVYTYFVLFAAPLFALGLQRVLQRWPLLRAPVIIGITFFAACSLLKATLDPTVSNRWIFYHPAEVEAIQSWATRHANESLWIGPDTRLSDGYLMEHSLGLPNYNSLDMGAPSPQTYHALNSPIKQANDKAWGYTGSPLLLEQRVYDNGIAQIYHRTPRTPLQK